MTTPRISRIVVSVSGLEQALGFYRDLLGLPVERAAGELAWLRTDDGVELMLHERPARASDTAVALGFLVDDVDATVARWIDDGGAVADAPSTRPWGERMAVVRDADGHLVCLSQPASAPA
ncbi:VOC family protein [Tsukamurella sp. 1534]|uniref:VOC family protein n=1 Tax=Tsukamurella sp. 1534 TaxID=1151061 RepID=UPI0002DF6D18|nr:VOC family protein [Tsukamurella sp. 1534]